jgi:hypothetical protein
MKYLSGARTEKYSSCRVCRDSTSVLSEFVVEPSLAAAQQGKKL